MSPVRIIEGVERLAQLSASSQAFVLGLGCILVALFALAVSLKALSRRSR